MQIYEALINDHNKLKQLLTQLVSMTEASESSRTELIQAIRDELVPHSRAEEAVFYNSLRDIDGVKGLVAHSYAEHMEAETLLRSLQAMNAIDAGWRATALKLQDALEHHIQEEETQVIPAARQVLAEEEATMMADAFQQMKPEVKEEGFMQNTLDMIANVMPKRFGDALRNFRH